MKYILNLALKVTILLLKTFHFNYYYIKKLKHTFILYDILSSFKIQNYLREFDHDTAVSCKNQIVPEL